MEKKEIDLEKVLSQIATEEGKARAIIALVGKAPIPRAKIEKVIEDYGKYNGKFVFGKDKVLLLLKGNTIDIDEAIRLYEEREDLHLAVWFAEKNGRMDEAKRLSSIYSKRLEAVANEYREKNLDRYEKEDWNCLSQASEYAEKAGNFQKAFELMERAEKVTNGRFTGKYKRLSKLAGKNARLSALQYFLNRGAEQDYVSEIALELSIADKIIKESLEKARQVEQNKKWSFFQGGRYSYTIGIAEKTGRKDKAIEIANECLQIIEQNWPQNYGEIADYSLVAGLKEKAKEYAMKVILQREREEEKKGQYNNLEYLASYAEQYGLAEEAQKLRRKYIELSRNGYEKSFIAEKAKKFGFTELSKEVYEASLRECEIKGNFKNAAEIAEKAGMTEKAEVYRILSEEKEDD